MSEQITISRELAEKIVSIVLHGPNLIEQEIGENEIADDLEEYAMELDTLIGGNNNE